MPQVLKDEIRESILSAARAEFYKKDYQSATMRGIAAAAHIPTGLIYSYYKNKRALLDEVLRPVCYDWKVVLGTDEGNHPDTSKLSTAERDCILSLFEHRQEFIIMVDKSHGTDYQGQKKEMIGVIESHLNKHLSEKKYDSVLIHIIATNFVEGLLQIMYHYKNKEWAITMLDKITKMYFSGIGL